METMPDRGEGLTYREQLPLRLEILQGSSVASQLLQLNASNEMLLRTCLAVFDSRELEERDEVSQELARMDLKLDLLLSTIQLLVKSQAPQPDPVPLTLTAEGLSWSADTGPAMPDGVRSELSAARTVQVRVDIYVNPAMAVPLAFYGYLEWRGATDASGEWFCKFTSASPQVSELLEKLIFSFHRRAVALERLSTLPT
jgi:hypothetical protein